MSTRSLAQRIKDALHEQQQVINRLQSENAKLKADLDFCQPKQKKLVELKLYETDFDEYYFSKTDGNAKIPYTIKDGKIFIEVE
jgi:hypothetical protein